MPTLIDLPAGCSPPGRSGVWRWPGSSSPTGRSGFSTSRLTALDAAAEAMLGAIDRARLTSGGMVVAATHRPLPVAPSATLALGGAAAGSGDR